MSDDPNNEYFADGISEEILNLLAKVRELQVTSRSSAFSFKGQNVDVPTMAAKLNVAYVLEGSVRKSGDQLRITAQLIEVATDTHLWSETYDRELRNVFAIQDEIAAAVVDALQITLLGKKPKVIETDPEAYALYLQGRHFSNRGTAEASKQAETLLLQSLEIDPGFAPAWVALSWEYRLQVGVYGTGTRPIDEGRELARHAAQQAVAADPLDGRAYGALASVEMSFDWDFTAASQHLQQALALNPADAGILRSAAKLERIFGRVDKAIDLYRQSIVLDPLSGHTGLGMNLYFAHRSEEAVASMQMALSLNPESERTRYLLGLVLLAQGDAAAALAVTEQLADDGDGWRVAGLAVVQHALGNTAASDSALRELIECCAANSAYQVAQANAFRGETDDAFDWLGHAYDNRDPGLTRMLVEPEFSNLHNDPRWESILDKMGLPH
jgi:adenylate cyclase